MTLSETISHQLKEAMKAKDETRLRTLRSIRAEILKKEKEGKGGAGDEEVVQLVNRLLKQRHDSIEQFEKAGREDLASAERAEAAVLEEFLPESLSEEEIDLIVQEAVAASGAVSEKEIGKVMGLAMGRLKASGKLFDGGQVNRLVREKLAE